MKENKLQNPVLASLLSIVPGLGQLYNKQFPKAIAFFAIFIVEVIEWTIFGGGALNDLITLGSTPREHHSLFMLIKGVIQIIACVLFIVFHILCMRDAYITAKRINSGEPVPRTVKEISQSVYENGFAYLLIIPAYIVMIFAIIFPVIVTILIAFTNYDFQHIPPNKLLDWVGVTNFMNMVQLSTFRSAFTSVLTWTLIWTFCASTLQITLGVATAVIANQPFIKFKRIFGVIFLLPWAVPAFITILSFSSFFNDSIGAMNLQVIPFFRQFLPMIGPELIPWKTDPTWTKIALIMIQVWLGSPYIYVLVSGILQSIPDDLYEAATVDGATAWQKFSKITLPMILAVAAPTFITQYTFNFNNFSIIYLFHQGGPGSVGGGAGATDILISWIYKLTTQTQPQYSLASAVTLVISLIVISVSLITFKKLNAFNMEDR